MTQPANELFNGPQNSNPVGIVAIGAQLAAPSEDPLTAVDTVVQLSEQETSVPVSPLGMHGMRELLKKPFVDVLTMTASSLQLKANAHVAAEQLRFCLHHDSSHLPELINSPVLGMLTSIVKEAPGLPIAGSALAVLAMVATTPDGRARLRLEGAIPPLMKFLSMPGVLQKPNAEHALLLLQNASCDKQCRQLILKLEGLTLMLELLKQYAGWLRQHPELSGPMTAALSHLVVGDMDNMNGGCTSNSKALTAKQMFVRSGGIEVVCRAVAEWGRAEPPPYILRLRLLLHELSHTPQYTAKVQDTALDAGSSSARSATAAAAAAGQHSPSAAAVNPDSRPAGMAGSLQGAAAAACSSGSSVSGGDAVVKDYVDNLGKGVILGTPRMPASMRITAEVLKHGKPNVGATPRPDEQPVAAQKQHVTSAV